MVANNLLSDETEMTKIVRLLGFVFEFILCFMAYRNFKIATGIISIIIFLRGLGAFVFNVSYFFINHEQFWMQIFAIVYGVVFTYGGIKLILIAFKGSRKIYNEKSVYRKNVIRGD